jgi:hypothetical protein
MFLLHLFFYFFLPFVPSFAGFLSGHESVVVGVHGLETLFTYCGVLVVANLAVIVGIHCIKCVFAHV